MLNKISKVDNPLTIIAIFSGITEVAASTALPFLQADVQQIFVWFLVLFPFALIAAFFLTLNFNMRVLYAPGDYRDESNFLQALHFSEHAVQVSVTSVEDETPSIEKLEETARSKTPTFEGITDAELKAVNDALNCFTDKAKSLFEADLISNYIYGICGEGIFLLELVLKESYGPKIESRIIRVRTITEGKVELRTVGRDIKSCQPRHFAELLYNDVKTSIENRRRQAHLRKRAMEGQGAAGCETDL